MVLVGANSLFVNCVYVFVYSRHETEPTVIILIDRRHGNWSSVKSILQAVNVSDISILSASVSLVMSLCNALSSKSPLSSYPTVIFNFAYC